MAILSSAPNHATRQRLWRRYLVGIAALIAVAAGVIAASRLGSEWLALAAQALAVPVCVAVIYGTAAQLKRAADITRR